MRWRRAPAGRQGIAHGERRRRKRRGAGTAKPLPRPGRTAQESFFVCYTTKRAQSTRFKPQLCGAKPNPRVRKPATFGSTLDGNTRFQLLACLTVLLDNM